MRIGVIHLQYAGLVWKNLKKMILVINGMKSLVKSVALRCVSIVNGIILLVSVSPAKQHMMRVWSVSARSGIRNLARAVAQLCTYTGIGRNLLVFVNHAMTQKKMCLNVGDVFRVLVGVTSAKGSYQVVPRH